MVTWTTDTPTGVARLHADLPEGSGGARAPAGVLVLGHGAGGGVDAPDLVATAAAAVAAGWVTVRVEQPWRVAGRRVAPAPARLDAAWVPLLRDLRDPNDMGGLGNPRGPLAAATGRVLPAASPLVVGGRSAGARVACRTAAAVGAAGVVTLAFPLHPPGRPERSRAGELALPAVGGLPVLAVQGRRDAFGGVEEVRAVAPAGCTVVGVDGDHGLAAGASEAARAVSEWLVATFPPAEG